MRRFLVLTAVALLLGGCSGPAEETVGPGIHSFGGDLVVCPDDPPSDAGLEPEIIILKGVGPDYQLVGSNPGMSYEEWCDSPAGKLLPALEHNEDIGLGIDIEE